MKSESEVAQSCPTLYDPMDCSLPGSSVHGFPRQKYWSGLPFPSPGDLPDPGIKPGSPALQADSLLSVIQNILPIVFQHPPAYSSKQRGRKVDKRSSANRVS